MATATRVLATLRQEGLVLARPGIGEIGREDVIRTAMAIADAEGSAALSMRRVATELGVATMSLYRYVTGKDDLLERMVDAAFGDHRLPAPPPGDWLVALDTAARTLWRLFRRHPWAAQTMSLTRPQVTPHALACSEWVMSALHATGLTPAGPEVHLTVFGHLLGLAVGLEPEKVAEQETGLTYSEFADSQDAAFTALVSSGAYPTFPGGRDRAGLRPRPRRAVRVRVATPARRPGRVADGGAVGPATVSAWNGARNGSAEPSS